MDWRTHIQDTNCTIALVLNAVLLHGAAKKTLADLDLDEKKTLNLKHQFNKQAETTVPRSTTRNFKLRPQEAPKHNIPPRAHVPRLPLRLPTPTVT